MTDATLPAKVPLKRRAVRVVRRLCRSGAIMYLLVCLVIAAFQTTLIFPGSMRQGTADVQFDPLPGSERLRTNFQRIFRFDHLLAELGQLARHSSDSICFLFPSVRDTGNFCRPAQQR